MKLAKLQEVFKEDHPTGNIVQDAVRGQNQYIVWFATGSRGYTYYAKSVYALAERLELIPEVDIISEAKAIADKLTQSPEAEVVAPGGCGDTVAILWQGDGTISEIPDSLDEFDRPLSRYYIADASAWTCTY
jgi:hypothetical protein